jgi:CheY-like chemotaxis protein
MRKSKFHYQEAENGLQALNSYKSTTTSFDVILMDLSMPIMDGITSTHHIRSYEKSKGLPRSTIIALTGLASASARLEAMSSGVDYYLTKPVSFAKLMGFLMPLVDGGSSR